MDAPLTQDQFLDLLNEHKIVPEVLKPHQVQHLKAPLQILYPNDLIVGQGEEVARNKVGDIPTILFTEADRNATYSLFMIDPDLLAHNSQSKVAGQVNHWYLSNLSFDPSTKKSSGVKAGASQTDYVRPTPALGSGPHRYIFILAREPESYTASLTKMSQGNSDLKGRLELNISQFLEEDHLIVESIGFMRVGADVKSTIENVGLIAESIRNKIVGK